MKKTIMKVAFGIAIATTSIFINCDDETELSNVDNCSETTYKVTSGYEKIDENTVGSDREVKIYTSDDEPFTEDLTVVIHYQVSGSTSRRTVNVVKGSTSPQQLWKYPSIIVGIILDKVVITSASCNEPIEKSDEDIAADSEEFECDPVGSLSINEMRCETEYVYSWVAENVNLSNATYAIYGVSIDLSQDSPQSVPVSSLDLEDESGAVSGISECITITWSDSECDYSCNDGIQNGDETGIDCGGSCVPCQVAESTVTLDATPYTITFADYSINTVPNPDELTITIVSENMAVLDLALGIVLYDNTGVFDSGTYSVNAADQGIDSSISGGSTNDGMDIFDVTDGSVNLTKNQDGTYTVEYNLTTTDGTFTGIVSNIAIAQAP